MNEKVKKAFEDLKKAIKESDCNNPECPFHGFKEVPADPNEKEIILID